MRRVVIGCLYRVDATRGSPGKTLKSFWLPHKAAHPVSLAQQL